MNDNRVGRDVTCFLTNHRISSCLVVLYRARLCDLFQESSIFFKNRATQYDYYGKLVVTELIIQIQLENRGSTAYFPEASSVKFATWLRAALFHNN